MPRLICNNCKEVGQVCDECGKLFKVDEEILCINFGKEHYCEECKQGKAVETTIVDLE